jgi:predicted ribosomally synthesized peptide with SipW-like signal peptide
VRRRRTDEVGVRRRVLLLGVALLAVSVALGAGRLAGTYAAWSDTKVIESHTVRAGEWAVDEPLYEVPEACSHIVFANVFLLGDGGDHAVVDGELVPVGDGSGAFHGTEQNDLIINTGGRRTIHGKGGDDCLVAGPDGDQLHGGPGDDVLLGGEGPDKLHGHFGDNLLDGEEGRDVCSPGPGNDTLVNCDIPHESEPSATTQDDEGSEPDQQLESSSADEGADASPSDLDPELDGDPVGDPDEDSEDVDEDEDDAETEEGADP